MVATLFGIQLAGWLCCPGSPTCHQSSLAVGPWIPSDRWAVLSQGTETDNNRANGVSIQRIGGGRGATKVDPSCVAIK